MTRWPLWRLLIWTEAWIFAVAAFHRTRPIHEEFIVPLLMGVVPAIVIVAIWGFARAAVSHTAVDHRASWFEVTLAVAAMAAATGWTVEWAIQAREDLRRIDAALGQATIIIDVSLTGLSAAACLAALALDWLLSTAHEQLRNAMAWLRRSHMAATVLYVLALFGSALLFTQWPDTPASESAAMFHRARVGLYVYEFAKATVFPVQAFFAAAAVAVVALDSRSE